MAGREPDGEREYLLELAGRLEYFLAEAGRMNRRLRNARNAVHALEDELTRLCEEVSDRARRLGEVPEGGKRE